MSIGLVIFVLLKLITCTENRICSGAGGVGCCSGFALNKLSGKCEKCSIGYHGNNCSLKCSPPTYGEGCQTLCNCPDMKCHFVHGCSKQFQTSTDDLRYTSPTAVFPTSNIKIYNHTVVRIFTKDVSHFDDTTVSDMQTSSDLLKNNIVIGFIGVFAISFTIFVLAYIFFKCYHKITDVSRTKEAEKQDQYKLVRIEAEEQGQTTYRDLNVQLGAESAYLSPVFRNTNDPNDNQGIGENGTWLENYANLRAGAEPTNREDDSDILRDGETKHVYLEI